MDTVNIVQIRLISQQLAKKYSHLPNEIISWMGAIQAQDYPMAKWAIGLRLLDATDALIESAINNGEILRTHLLRPTWHFVSAEDIYWLLELSAQQIKAAQRSRDRQLELTEEVYSKSNAIIEKALSDGNHQSREELVGILSNANIATDQNRASHLLMRAELEKIICSGVIRNGKPTYALLSERVKSGKNLKEEEALFELATRYFTSRCPATTEDFAWWSGLPAGRLRQTLAMVKGVFHKEEIQGKSYILPDDFNQSVINNPTTFLLPPYDEFILSYADRNASIAWELESHLKEISDRGIFRPIIVMDGQVVGAWKRTIGKKNITIEVNSFYGHDISSWETIRVAASQYATFVNMEIQIVER